MNFTPKIHMSPLDRIEAHFPHWRYGHPRVLYSLVRLLMPEFIVEVGTLYGYAAAYMAQALKENGKGHLFAIDNFMEKGQKTTGPKEWYETMKTLDLFEQATLIIGDSITCPWPDKVDFAYIDGWHGTKHVISDFENCAKRGATAICFDDVSNCVGPKLFMQQMRSSAEWDPISFHSPNGNGLGMLSKRKRIPLTCSQETEWKDITGWPRKDVREFLDTESSKTGIIYGDDVIDE